MAFSPLCPKGGFPISWAKAAAATIAPKSLGLITVNLLVNGGVGASETSFPAKRPKLLATTDTSKLWVSRVWTKSVLEKGMTWVLS